MTESIRDSIYDAIASIRLIDPHTHINPHSPASHTLADLLGYHYYTELAHSAGMPKDQIEEPGLDPRELVWRLVNNLSPIENTAQYRWLIEICRQFFGFEGDRIDQSNWEELYDAAERQMASAEWPQMVLDQSNVEAVFLTNDFDDPLEGFDTDTYIPCLRTDDLVFHLEKPTTRQRLAACTEIELDGSLSSLRESLTHRFEHFVEHGARACAISLPPTFEPTLVSDGRASTALDHVLRQGSQADPSHKNALARRVFWTLAELCDEYGLPFDLMIGVNRGVYAEGVYQGQDLYDSRVSLIQYRELFNAFPAVKFPVSVLASVTNQELVSYAWIFPNVITNGHWWYSNTPSFIARDAAARLEAVPQTKQIAYYSDAYKLEFVWPKFDMYRRILAGILADHFVKGCGWSEERAIELGRQVLRDNVDEIFPAPVQSDDRTQSEIGPETWFDPSDAPVVGAVAPAIAAAAAIDMDDDIDQEEDSMDESGGLDLVDVEQEDSPQVEVGESVETPVLSLGAAVQDELDSGDETQQQDEDEVEELPALGMDEGEKDNWDGSHPDQPVDEGEMEELAVLGLVSSEQDDAESVAEADTEDGEIDELAALGLIDAEQEALGGDAVADQEEAKSEDELAALGLEVDEHEDLIGEKEADEADAADEVLEESEDELAALGLEDAEGADWSGDDEANVLVDESEDELTALGLGDAGGADDGDAEDAADADLNGEDQADQAVEESENELVALGLQDADDAEGPDWSGDDQTDVAFEEDELAALGLDDGDDDNTSLLDSDDAPEVAAAAEGEVEELPALGMDEGEKDNWDGSHPDQPVDEG
jgi:glucuronate isomerase